MTDPKQMLSLVADVGGTNTRVGLARGTALDQSSVTRFRNEAFDDLGAVLSAYMAERALEAVDGAAVAMAGPVRDGVAELTNLNWRIDLPGLRAVTGGTHAAVLNDLQAQGYGLTHIAPQNLREIVPGPTGDGTKVVVGIGTGFNIAPVYPTPNGAFVPPSEAGHVSLPVHSQTDLSLAAHVAQSHGFADVEEVLSGRGVENVYAWLRQEAGDPGQASANDIFASFSLGGDPFARATFEAFARVMGVVTGDIALNTLPTGGIFFSGGVARALGRHLLELGFREAFRNKGRFSGFMDGFAIHVIEDDFAALSGAAEHLVQAISASDIT
ncbi:Glucokinase [Candidatus Rhodobacter oscarellae]|uniref:Glucokinase n=1 Tax=Candidatus Rhodobacter oscarellae TaxID=1675527 RepID=A0A0J9E3U0_9RHOB|nr:glucokinase [Candidatus Rhodobacter lobularis]KMW57382.1 Glucokinase [Candidatus Rhodobacter lobularis]